VHVMATEEDPSTQDQVGVRNETYAADVLRLDSRADPSFLSK
jgi:hypothetical protein